LPALILFKQFPTKKSYEPKIRRILNQMQAEDIKDVATTLVEQAHMGNEKTIIGYVVQGQHFRSARR
jgi:hypothetical protein